jgi:hypothetical protein
MAISDLELEPYSLSPGDSIYAKIKAINEFGTSMDSSAGNGATYYSVPEPPKDLQNDLAVTSDTVVGIIWSDGYTDGGSAIIDYRVWYDQGTDNWIVADNAVTTREYRTTDSLIAGETYKFKVEARNLVGYSSASNEVSILAAREPDAPAAPTTLRNGDSIVINWIAPYNGGSEITGYYIMIKSEDGTFIVDEANCDGTSPTILSNKQCTIPFSVLEEPPFNLPWGSSVYATVRAINAYGSSLESPEGNGGAIITNPDAPINLVESVSERTLNSIGFSWQQGPNNGGSAVIDFRIYYD